MDSHSSLSLLIQHFIVQCMFLLPLKDTTRKAGSNFLLQGELNKGKKIVCPLLAPDEIAEIIGELSI